MNKIAVLAILVAFGQFISLTVRAVQNEKASTLKPLEAISGADSQVRKLSYERITDSETWTRASVNHLGTTKEDAYRSLCEVDFERCSVVVIFRGEQVNVRGIEIDSLIETGDSTVIRFNELGYQTRQRVGEKPEPPDRPYAFVVLPKTNKAFVLEENVQNIIGDPPVWKECARLEGSRTVERQN